MTREQKTKSLRILTTLGIVGFLFLTFLLGAAVGVMAMQKDPRNPDFRPLIEKSHLSQEAMPSMPKVEMSTAVDRAMRFNSHSPRAQIKGWTLDRKYPIYNVEGTLTSREVVIGGEVEFAENILNYNLDYIAVEDVNSEKYTCAVLCVDTFGQIIGLNPATKKE